MRLTFPTVLTFARLLAAPGLVVMFLYFNRPWADWYALVLFGAAAVTDWFDGYLARAWKETTRLGAMLDPIADKAMVVIALMTIVGYSTMSPWIVLPAAVIVLREVFVSGLREYLGDAAGTLKVTGLAKWKTTAQMIAIATLFAQGVFEHYALTAEVGDWLIAWMESGEFWSGRIGLWLLWIAAALTLITGVDYFRKSLPHLRD